VIPGNDDAIRSIRLLTSKIAEAITEIRGVVPVEEDMEPSGDGQTPEEAEFGTAAVVEPEPMGEEPAPEAAADVVAADVESIPAEVYDEEEVRIEDALRHERERTEPDH
jgi:small subunit ribosomal protein S2